MRATEIQPVNFVTRLGCLAGPRIERILCQTEPNPTPYAMT